jgi:hypothetical protein
MSSVARIAGLLIAVCLPLWGWGAAEAAPTISKVDVESFSGACITGGGWAPNEKVKLQLEGQGASDLGTVTADNNGNIDSCILPKNNLIDVGDNIQGTGPISGTSSDVNSAKAHDTQIHIDLFLPQEMGFHLNLNFNPTGLLEGAFIPGTVNLIGTSANVSIESETTSYNSVTDTLTTDGIFDFSAPGLVFFTYEATGVFSLAVDPATGDPLTGVQISDAEVEIGAVSEPNAMAMLVIGILGTLGCAWRRRATRPLKNVFG